jgi:hypothetical protein
MPLCRSKLFILVGFYHLIPYWAEPFLYAHDNLLLGEVYFPCDIRSNHFKLLSLVFFCQIFQHF